MKELNPIVQPYHQGEIEIEFLVMSPVFIDQAPIYKLHKEVSTFILAVYL